MSESDLQETKPLVLIIGAGAGSSSEVGLPVNKSFKEKIAEALNFKVEDDQITGGNKLIREALQRLSQEPAQFDRNYLAAAQLIHNAMPQAPSIEHFIDSHRENIAVATCGKLAIASCTLEAEKNSILYVDERNGDDTLKFTEVSETWFNTLFQMISMNTKGDDLKARLKQIVVISFNYDRSLEHFLYHSLKNYYGMDSQRAFDLLKHLKIYYPYGKAGNLFLPGSYWSIEVGYGNDPRVDTKLIQIARLIKTFTESLSEINEIQSIVQNAKRIAFLGFEYSDLNLNLLYGQNNGENEFQSKAKVYGTAHDISKSNRHHIITELKRLGGYDKNNIKIKNLTAAELLNEYSLSLAI